jgi:putative ABC transport system permease protein
MASIGEGARREALRQIERMGATNILIDDQIQSDNDDRKEALEKSPHGVTVADADALREIITDAIRVVPMKVEEREVKGGAKAARLTLVAAPPDLFELSNLSIMLGRKLDPSDETDKRRVCVLGWGARRELFPLVNPIGREIVTRNVVFTVVGVLNRRTAGSGEIEGVKLRDENRDIYLPLSVAISEKFRLSTGSDLSRIAVQMPHPEGLNQVADVARRVMIRRHREVEDYKVIVPEQLLKQHQSTQRIFNIVMGTIASISLLVGGIGIMNIMLASVLERTREIGVRRAVGATQGDITRQFLTEAILLSLSGGVVGVGLGIALAQGISSYARWETAVSLWAVVAAVSVSIGVGVIFGWLPARRAAKLDPITALRYE